VIARRQQSMIVTTHVWGVKPNADSRLQNTLRIASVHLVNDVDTPQLCCIAALLAILRGDDNSDVCTVQPSCSVESVMKSYLTEVG
jgi:hypothetical protein